MKAHLSAPISVHVFVAVATVRVWTDRPEILAICRALQGGATLAEAVEGLLPGAGEPGRARIGRHLQDLGVADARGLLTEQGRLAVAEGRVPWPERGAFRFWFAQHAVTGPMLLGFERAGTTPAVDIVPAPPALRADPLRVHVPALGEASPFSLVELHAPSGASPVVAPEETLLGRLVGELDPRTGANRWHVELDDQKGLRASDLPSLPEGTCAGLVGRWLTDWDDDEQWLPISWDGHASPDGRDTFLRTRELAEAEIPGVGFFRDVRLEDVPVGPADMAAGRAWAAALVRRRVANRDRYTDGPTLRRDEEACVRGTPLAASMDRPLDPHEVADAASPRVASLVWTPTDLALEA